MPFKTEHAARQHDPREYVTFRRGQISKRPSIFAIFGVLPTGTVEIQSFRFPVSAWTPIEARKWLRLHGLKSKVEPAKESRLTSAKRIRYRSGRRG